MSAVAIFNKHGQVLINNQEMKFVLGGFGPNETHAIHIHEYGDLRTGCASLGAHYHTGVNQPHGYHAGDLMFNFTTDDDGLYSARVPHQLELKNLYGRSFVIHRHPDDMGARGNLYGEYRHMPFDTIKALCFTLGYPETSHERRVARLEKESLTTGNAGERMDCAIIGRAL